MNKKALSISGTNDYYLYTRKVGTKSIYYVRFMVRGQTYTRSTRTGNYKDACKFAGLELSKFPSSKQSFKNYAEKYFTKECPHITRIIADGKTYGDKQKRDNRSLLERVVFTDKLANIPLTDIKRSDIIDFRQRLIQSFGKIAKVNNSLKVLKIIFNEALLREDIFANPCDKVGRIKIIGNPRIIPNNEQWINLLKKENWTTINGSIYWMASTTAALTGMRAGEVRALTWKQLDEKMGTILVNASLLQEKSKRKGTKSEKDRFTIYPKALQSILEPYRGKVDSLLFINPLTKKVIGYNSWLRAFNAAAKKSKAVGVTLHCLRHKLNTFLLDSNVSPEKVRAIFGWSGNSSQNTAFGSVNPQNVQGAQIGYTHADQFDITGQTQIVDSLLGQP